MSLALYTSRFCRSWHSGEERYEGVCCDAAVLGQCELGRSGFMGAREQSRASLPGSADASRGIVGIPSGGRADRCRQIGRGLEVLGHQRAWRQPWVQKLRSFHYTRRYVSDVFFGK